MVEHEALKKLKHKDERALEWFIDRYAAYVNTIIYNIIGLSMSSADIEEVSSDVFFTLWVNAKRISPGKVKAYLGGVARNKAKEYTRKIGTGVSLEDDVILISEENLEQDFEEREQARFIREAVLAMKYPEREIFLRYYYYYQSITEIAEEIVSQRMEADRLHQAIAQLPEKQRRRLVLYYFGEFTYEQIADMEGCKHPAVMKSISSALKKLKKYLSGEVTI